MHFGNLQGQTGGHSWHLWAAAHHTSLVAQMVKRPPTMWEIQVRIPGSGRSPGEGNGNPLWDSCLDNSMNRGAW